MVVPKNQVFGCGGPAKLRRVERLSTDRTVDREQCLAAEAVEGLALAFEGVDNVHGGDGLAASVLGVGHGVADDVLQEYLEDATSLRMQ